MILGDDGLSSDVRLKSEAAISSQLYWAASGEMSKWNLGGDRSVLVPSSVPISFGRSRSIVNGFGQKGRDGWLGFIGGMMTGVTDGVEIFAPSRRYDIP